MPGESNLFVKDFSSAAILSLEQDTVWTQLIPTYGVPWGVRSVSIPTAPTVTDPATVSGNALESAFNTSYVPTYDDIELTINQDYQIKWDIQDHLLPNITADAAMMAGYESGQKMADQIDQYFADQLSAGMTANSLDIRNGGSLGNPTGYKLLLTGNNEDNEDGRLMFTHFARAEEHLMSQRSRASTWRCVVFPSAKRLGMLDDPRVYSSNSDRGDIRTHDMALNDARYIGDIGNFPVYVATNYPRLHGTGTAGTKDAVIWFSTDCAVKHIRAVDAMPEAVRDRLFKGTQYRQEFQYGFLVTRPNLIVRATYDTVSTS